MGDKEQTKAERDAGNADVPPAGNKPPGQHTNSDNTTGTGGDEHRPREPHEKRIREWLIVLFTGTIVVGTLYYASIAKRQADLMSQQRDVMIQQVNAAQRQIDEMKSQSGTFDKTLTSTQGIEKDTGRQANSSQDSAKAAQQSVGIARQSFTLLERPSLGVEGAGEPYLEIGKPVFVPVVVKNFGHVPASDVTVVTSVWADPVINTSAPCPEPRQAPVIIGLLSRSLIAVNSTRIAEGASVHLVTAEDIDRINVKKVVWIYVYLTVRYGDKGRYFLEYYARSNATTKSWDECGSHNRAN